MLFDVAPGRAFDCDGKLLVSKEEGRDETWQKRVDLDCEGLDAGREGAWAATPGEPELVAGDDEKARTL